MAEASREICGWIKPGADVFLQDIRAEVEFPECLLPEWQGVMAFPYLLLPTRDKLATR